MMAWVHGNPEQVKETICTPDWCLVWLAAFRTRLARAERDAVQLWPRLVGMLGEEKELAVLVLSNIGAKDLDEARRYVRMAKLAEVEDEHVLAAKAGEYLANYHRRHPAMVAESLRRQGIAGQEAIAAEQGRLAGTAEPA